MGPSAEHSLAGIKRLLGGTAGIVSSLGLAVISIVRDYKPTFNVTIASGGTASSSIDFRGRAGGGFVVPAAFTGTSITYQVSVDNSNFGALYDQFGAQVVTASVAVSRRYALPAELYGWPYFKIVSGSAEGGDRTIAVVLAG